MRAVVASFAVHAGLAVGLVAGAGGHAPAGGVTTPVPEVMEIDTATETIAAPEPRATRTGAPAAHPVSHTHPYPMPADHDARPHEPSQAHAHPGAIDHDHAASPAPPIVVNDAPKLPVFSMSSGNGSMPRGSVRVAADARGENEGTAGAAAGPGAAGPAGTYAAAAVSVPARLASGVTAAYPPDARADDVEGDVGLEIVVDAEGRVAEARVVSRAGHGFDESALLAIRAYRFAPAERGGQRVRVRMPWTVQFRLR